MLAALCLINVSKQDYYYFFFGNVAFGDLDEILHTSDEFNSWSTVEKCGPRKVLEIHF